MLLKQGPLTANIHANFRYAFELVESGTYVRRALDLTIRTRGIMKLAEPLIVLRVR